MSTIVQVLNQEKAKLISTIVIIFILLFLASSAMYYVENAAQPDKFPNIIATFWWAVATLTTVGYGDVYPITTLGKILGGIISILGVGMVGLPSGIIAGGFTSRIVEKENVGEAFDKADKLSEIKRRIIEENLIPSLQELGKKLSLDFIWDDIDEKNGEKFWFGFENVKFKYVYIFFQFAKYDFKGLRYVLAYQEGAEKMIPEKFKCEIKKLGNMNMGKYQNWDKDVFVLLGKKDNDVIRAIENKTIELQKVIEEMACK
jgi:hypothetical protein